MTGPEHIHLGKWLTQWDIDTLLCTGAVVILRDQAEDPYCSRYDYISQQPSELDLVKDHRKNPNPNNSSDWGKTGIRIGCEDQTWRLESHVTFRQEGLRHLSWSGDGMAEAEVDPGDSVGWWWTILHMHTQGQGQHGRDGRRSTTHKWAWGGMPE